MNINFEITKDGNSEIALTEHSVKTLMSDSISETGINLRNSKRMREVTVEWVINVEFLTIGAREVEDTIKIADFAVILEYADCCKDLNYKMVDNTGNFVREKGLDAVYVAYYEEMFCNYKGVGEFAATFREKSKGGTLV